ncbi:hypothetical protein PT105_05850 [Erysipelothrix rhusiopathiae]|nr:hypothetical protein [Erysipelothrix rhusiopathiae]
MTQIIELGPDERVVIEKDKIIITEENTATENSDVNYQKPVVVKSDL